MKRLPRTTMQLLVLSLAIALVMSACAAPPPPVAAPAGEASGPAAEAVPAAPPVHNLTDGCIESFDPNVDYFPEKVSVTFASGFQVAYHNSYKVVTVTSPWQGAEESFRYILVQCGAPAPEGVDGAVIQVPVDTVVALSTTYIPALESLGLLDKLVGMDSYLWTTNEAVRARIDAGEIAEVGSGSTINVEQVLDLDPGLVLAYGIGIPDYDAHPVLLDAGIPTALDGDFVEQNPLGRTEWMKFIALFFNKEAEAQAQFDQIVNEYQRVAALAADVAEKPTVLVGSVYNGTWYVAGGKSYTAKLLADAGSAYLWADDESVGSLPLDFEAVFEKAHDAEFWVNPDNAFWFTIEDVLASDERYGDFAPVQNGRLYNNNAIVNENGGNAFYESGAAHPEVILKDLVKIFHPDLLPDHELVYYRQVK